MKVIYFKSAAEFREWLQRHHATASELWLGFYKKDSGITGINYPEALDEALCFGWIDGIRKRLDDVSYTNRFSPRKPRSNWSIVNVRRVEQLRALGRMAEAGLKAFEERDVKRIHNYSYERIAELDVNSQRTFKANKKAWAFYQAQPPGYRRVTTHWIMSAKREETRISRLTRLIHASSQRSRISLLTGKVEPRPVRGACR